MSPLSRATSSPRSRARGHGTVETHRARRRGPRGRVLAPSGCGDPRRRHDLCAGAEALCRHAQPLRLGEGGQGRQGLPAAAHGASLRSGVQRPAQECEARVRASACCRCSPSASSRRKPRAAMSRSPSPATPRSSSKSNASRPSSRDLGPEWRTRSKPAHPGDEPGSKTIAGSEPGAGGAPGTGS